VLFSVVRESAEYSAFYAEFKLKSAFLAEDFARDLDPRVGKGSSVVDMRGVLPKFLVPGEISWPSHASYTFGGDADVPHRVPFEPSSEALRSLLGEGAFSNLVAFGDALTDTIGESLPSEEKRRMRANRVRLTLDLAEIRCEDGTKPTPGERVHIDWEPREGMVLVVPLVGQPPTIFPPCSKAPPAWGHGYFITGMGRWETFHSPTEAERRNWVTINEYGDDVRVPKGLIKYRDERAQAVYSDLRPDWPGVIPTVHRAGTGRRIVLILNLTYSSLV
jgi:hypothetical protein